MNNQSVKDESTPSAHQPSYSDRLLVKAGREGLLRKAVKPSNNYQLIVREDG